MRKVSAKTAARQAASNEKKVLNAAKTTDSFQSFSLKLGMGTDNALSGSTYGFNPITRNRTLLEWIHRGSWLGGVAVDLVADDMTRAGIEVVSPLPPDDEERLQNAETRLGLWGAVHECVSWSRLYGGAIMIPMIEGQNFETPLRLKTIGKGSLKGFLTLDRWMVDPSLEDLVSDFGPDFGQPKYYTITSQAPGLRGVRVHFSRCLRMVGIKLPYWQAVMENLWGISIFERLYDRMVSFDSATQGAAQLVYKSHLRVMGIDGMREAIAAGGAAEVGLIKFTQFCAKYQSIEGITLLDAKDTFQTFTNTFGGISDLLLQFGQQLSGALQIPMVRLFGQSPAGLNSTGEGDLRTYYDGINSKQNRDLKEAIRTFYIIIGKSEGIPLPDTFDFNFTSLWQLTEEQRSEVAARDGDTIGKAFNDGIIDQPTAMKELRQSSRTTGRFTNITDEMIEEAEANPLPSAEMAKLTGQQEEDPSAPEEKEPEKPKEVLPT